MRSQVIIFGSLFLALGVLNGCSRAPQMKAPNRKILEALQTAVSSKNPAWLEAVTAKVVEKRDQKEMSDGEFRAIDAIIKKAQSGDWKKAQMDSFALSEGQRPTAEDLAMVKSGKNFKDLSPN
jgi:hypothetical protein